MQREQYRSRIFPIVQSFSCWMGRVGLLISSFYLFTSSLFYYYFLVIPLFCKCYIYVHDWICFYVQLKVKQFRIFFYDGQMFISHPHPPHMRIQCNNDFVLMWLLFLSNFKFNYTLLNRFTSFGLVRFNVIFEYQTSWPKMKLCNRIL